MPQMKIARNKFREQKVNVSKTKTPSPSPLSRTRLALVLLFFFSIPSAVKSFLHERTVRLLLFFVFLLLFELK